jgi:hypothetical protein
VYPQGGYKTITAVQIANALAELERGAITFRALRVYLACFELQARREAAERARRGKLVRRPPGVLYRPEELGRLLPDVGVAAARSELKRLTRARLLLFSPECITVTETPLEHAHALLDELCRGRRATRPIPIPRRMLVFLCRCRRPALVKTVLAYLVRGLSLERGTGEVRAAGAVKATWIARVFGLSERGVRSARAELIRLAVISKDEGSHQRKLNRDGAYFRVNLAWQDPARPEPRMFVSHDTSIALRSCSAPSPSAPPAPKKHAEFAGPGERPETPSDLKDQKLAARDGAGCCGKEREPDLRNIRQGDLRRLPSLRELYRQACAAGWLQRSEASFLAFAAAAVRANRAQGDPVRIFVAIVRRKLWHHITHADEERARVVIARANALGATRDALTRELLRRAAA